jgi:hypothetical protein
MPFLFPPEINVLFGVFLIVALLVYLLKWMKKSRNRKVKVVFDGPFIELDVNPVSEGDEIRYAYKLDNRYVANVRNKKKHANLDLEANSEEELRRKVQETFKAWSLGGKKRELPGDIFFNR